MSIAPVEEKPKRRIGRPRGSRKPRRDTIPVTVALELNFLDRVDDFAELLNVPRTEVVRRALHDYLEAHKDIHPQEELFAS